MLNAGISRTLSVGRGSESYPQQHLWRHETIVAGMPLYGRPTDTPPSCPSPKGHSVMAPRSFKVGVPFVWRGQQAGLWALA